MMITQFLQKFEPILIYVFELVHMYLCLKSTPLRYGSYVHFFASSFPRTRFVHSWWDDSFSPILEKWANRWIYSESRLTMCTYQFSSQLPRDSLNLNTHSILNIIRRRIKQWVIDRRKKTVKRFVASFDVILVQHSSAISNHFTCWIWVIASS